MPRATAADYLELWKSFPGSDADKTAALGDPFAYAREMPALDAALTDEQLALNDERAAVERIETARITKAFNAYFASTPEGLERGPMG